jgi:hypothetical protein
MIAHLRSDRGMSVEHPRKARPTPAEMGLSMTIGIAAIAAFDEYIVTVTDMRQSFGEEIQGVDFGELKDIHLFNRWGAFVCWWGFGLCTKNYSIL